MLGGMALLILVAALAYLRDPPWLADQTSGLGRPEQDESGTHYRWTAARAMFFVPSATERVLLPMRSPDDATAAWPVTVTVSVDDRPVAALTLRDQEWRTLEVGIPSTATSRRVRRVDLKLDRVHAHQRGVQLGDVQIVPRVR